MDFSMFGRGGGLGEGQNPCFYLFIFLASKWSETSRNAKKFFPIWKKKKKQSMFGRGGGVKIQNMEKSMFFIFFFIDAFPK